jgi:hypothetical protein
VTSERLLTVVVASMIPKSSGISLHTVSIPYD